MRRLSLFLRALCAVLLVGVAACSSGGGGTPQVSNRRAERASKPCPDKIPFEATYLPSGFTNRLEDGPGGNRSTIKNVTIAHYNGSGGRWIDVFRGGRRNDFDHGVAIKVLGRFGRIGHITNGFAIKFRLASQRCGLFQIEAFGIPSAEAVKVGHGLKPKD